MKKRVYAGKIVGAERQFSSFGALASHLRHNVRPRFKQAKVKALELIGNNVGAEIMDRLGYYQPGWAALAESTVKQKARKGWGRDGNPDSPLFATGAFWDDITFKVYRSLDEVEVGTTKKYVEYTEYGTAKMRPRPVFPMSYRAELPRCLPHVECILGDALSR